MNHIKIAAMIAAAGKSSRMSFPKTSLCIHHEPMLIATIKMMSRIKPAAIYVTLSPKLLMQEKMRLHLNILGAEIFLNRFMEHGYAGSIKTVIKASLLDGLLIIPVDVPLLTHSLIGFMLNLARKEADKPLIMVPSYGLSPGHPVFISRHFFRHFTKKNPLPLSQVIAHNRRFITKLMWPDRSVLYNLNSDQLVRLFVEQNPGANSTEAAAMDAPGVNFS